MCIKLSTKNKRRKNFLARVFGVLVAFALCRPQERGRQCANSGGKNRDKKLSDWIFFSFFSALAKKTKFSYCGVGVFSACNVIISIVILFFFPYALCITGG